VKFFLKLKLIKLLLVTALIGAAAAFKCFKTADGAVSSADCLEGTSSCHGPIFNILSGMTEQEYGCGDCAGDAAAAGTCEKCTAAECNKEKKAVEFECSPYTYTDSKWTKGETKTKCFKLEGTDGQCNTPASGATNEGDTKFTPANKGCGACAEGAIKCVNVSSALGLSALLLPLVAAFFALC